MLMIFNNPLGHSASTVSNHPRALTSKGVKVRCAAKWTRAGKVHRAGARDSQAVSNNRVCRAWQHLNDSANMQPHTNMQPHKKRTHAT